MLITKEHVHHIIRYIQELNPTKSSTHHLSFENISKNRFSQQINDHLISGYILNDNLFCLFGTSQKVRMLLDVFNLQRELQILNKLNDSNIVTHYFNRIINSRSETKILKKTPKLYCLLSSKAISSILCLCSQ